ncbi:MAG: CoA transferase [Chloroflexi bacterium]|nr:CoA transferase [Chloroflexota bacterium]MDA1145777.1 CoA transferase [Chloroflexota bacterium]
MLEGVRVIDLSADIGGAFAARLLAVYGADVILVEPPAGHAIRHRAPHLARAERDQEQHQHADDPDASILAAYYHAGKRSIVLDLDSAEDRATLETLIAGADAVIDSHAPGELLARGIDLVALSERFPALVVTQITPYGQTGPRAGWRATALTAAAAGGEMALCGDPEREPLKTAGHQAYLQGGLSGFSATATALYAAARSGVGDRIDLSIQEVQNSMLEGAGPAALTRGTDATRGGNVGRATWGIHPSKDGYIGVAGMPRQGPSVYAAIGHPEFKDDPLFGVSWSPEADAVLQVLVPEWTMQHTSKEIFELADQHRAPFAMIPTPRELLEWPGLVETGFWHEVAHPVLGTHPLPSGPIAFDGDRGTQQRAPLLGEHSDAVRAELPEASPVPASVATGAIEAPLAGLRVIDVTQVWAGPYACRFLGDQGADTIKIEGPAFPDSVRGLGGDFDPDVINRSSYFNEYNRNKRGLVINIQQREGADAIRRLVANADIFVENWSSGVADRLGLGYADLRAINPRLIYVSMPGFGHEGSDAHRIGYGPTIEQMGGLVALQGYEGGPPHKSGISYGDPISGTTTAGAVGIALHRRERSGEGCYIVVPQRDGIAGLIGEYVIAEAIGQPIPIRIGNRDLEYAPHNVYRTRDTEPRPRLGLQEELLGEETDTWLAIAVDSDEAWQSLRGVIGDARLDAAAYTQVEGRRAAQPAIDAVIAEWARDLEPDEAATRLQAAGVAASPVYTPLGLSTDAHLEARSAFTTYDHAVTGVQRTTLPVWRMARRPVTRVGPAPAFGQHNTEVLTELAGYSPEEVEAMAASGLTATTPVA